VTDQSVISEGAVQVKGDGHPVIPHPDRGRDECRAAKIDCRKNSVY
jgi:hypothetical protein